ncbi:MAG: MFS transporter [Synergistales bacterium]|nr:MFS transporter [Synergistales bacterium]
MIGTNMLLSRKNRKRTNIQITLLCLGHFINDLHIAFLNTFIPGIVQRLGISLAQAGFLNTLSGFINVIAQPFFGFLSDRTNYPAYIMIGPVLACLGAALLPVAPNYSLALLFVTIWATGAAIFHPQGTGAVGHICQEGHLSSVLAFFGLGGMLAGALSPLYAVALVKIVGIRWVPVAAMIPVLILIILVWWYIPQVQEKEAFLPNTGSFLHSFWSVFSKVQRIFFISFLRAISEQGIRFFLPLVVAARGGNLMTIGTVLFLVTIGAAISPVLCGHVADLFGRKKTLLVMLVVLPILLVPAALTEGKLSIFLYMMGYAALTATEPLTNAMAQVRAPGSRSMASSIVMGFAFGMGGLFTTLLGAVADHFGLTVTMLLVGTAPILAIPVVISPKWDNPA